MITRLREALADRLCWSAFQRDYAIARLVDSTHDDTPDMTWPEVDELVRSLAWVRLDSAIIDLQYAIAAALRPTFTIDEDTT